MNVINRNKLANSLETMLCALFFIMAILLYSLEIINATALLGAWASIATVYYGSLKVRLEHDLLFKSLFEYFNERYDKQMNDLINKLRLDTSKELNPDERNIIIDYFNLRAEEYLWRAKGRIPHDVWKAWKAGIVENLKIRQVKEVSDSETNPATGKALYYGLYEEARK